MGVENGYFYTFQFLGDRTSPYYENFESLLESVNYSAVENALPSKHGDVAGSTSPSNYEGPADRTQPSIFESDYIVIDLLFSLFITVTIYSVPIIIYRYAIIKMPVEKKRAKIITIVYGVIAFIVMSCLLFAINGSFAGVSIIFWSFVNYGVLTGGKAVQAKELNVKIPTVSSEEILVAKSVPADNFAYAAEGDQEETEAPRIPAETSPRKIMYCRRCGAKLIKGSKFCSNCGTLIEKDDIQ